MPARTRSQKIGDKGQNQVRERVDAHPHWMCRLQDLDYGVDLEAEYAPAEGDGQRPAGKLLKLQVKATETADVRGQVVHVVLERSFLSYALQFRLPVILVHVDVTTRSAWWLWLQAWALEHEERLASSPDNATITVHIPLHQTLKTGLDYELIDVVAGKHASAVVLALRELADVAASDGQQIKLFRGVLALLDDIEAPNRLRTAEKIIELLVGLGSNPGLWQTSQVIPQIVATVERLGDMFSQEQVLRLVLRYDSYSRAGLEGLATFYDRWPEKARAMDLPSAFRDADVEEVAWYCSAREHYADLSGYQLVMRFSDGKLPQTRFGKLQLRDDDDVSYRLLTKYPTRGNSILLDNLMWAETRAPEASSS
ncbi:DUF4365 domain-containing protein [Mesorhizobium sp. IMUNJ 23232]|uniref:DUF4365 domain-containing protein n=1 Tax=Mesorhizobium sp. IMUNJ 23232 TaxID=3376064 RepID=UPI0037AC0DB9